MKDAIGLYMSVADAVIIIIANDLKDAKATFGVWVDKIIADAKQVERIPELLEGKQIMKEIYVPGKLVNLVVK